MNATPAEVAIGQEIRSWRQRRGLTIVELAVKSGVSKASIERIERATHAINIQHAWRLADALDIKLSDVIERAERTLEIDDLGREAVARDEDRQKRTLSDD